MTPRSTGPGASSRAALLLLAVLWLLVVLPVFLGSALWFRDLLIYTYPQKLYVIARLRAGELPIWADVWGTGRPFFGVLQPGALDPFNAILLLPGTLGVDLYNFAHLAIAGLGLRSWMRSLGLDDIDACAGAALLGLSGYLVSMVATNGTYAWGVAFVPWILAALASGARIQGKPALARHIIAVALFLTLALLAGDPMAPLFGAVAGLAQCAAEPDPAARRRVLVLLAGGVALAGMLCAVQLLPALGVLRVYRGAGVGFRDAGNFSLHPLRLLEIVSPNALGEPYSAAWRAPALYTRTGRQQLLPLAIGIHQSVALVPLALAALRRRERLDRALWTLALAGLLLALGRHTPVWPWCYAHLPGFKIFRHPEKYAFLVTLALSALAARGLSVARASPRAASRSALVVALALTAASLGPLGVLGRLSLLSLALFHAALYAFVYAAAFHASSWEASAPRMIRALPLLVLSCELLAASLPLIRWTRSDVARSRSPFVAAIARDRGGSARGARLFRDLSLGLPVPTPGAPEVVASMMPNLGFADGIGHLDAYDAFHATRVRGLRTEVQRTPGALLRWWGVDYAIATTRGLRDPSLREVSTLPSLALRLLRVESTAPRVYLARESVSVRGPDEALRAARAPSFRPGTMATVEGPPRATEGRCSLRNARPEARTIACDASAPGWLIVGESFDPSWTALVNGAPVALARGNELFLAVPVPAGRSTVQMQARAWGLHGGAVLSALGLCVALGLWGWQRRSLTSAGSSSRL